MVLPTFGTGHGKLIISFCSSTLRKIKLKQVLRCIYIMANINRAPKNNNSPAEDISGLLCHSAGQNLLWV